MGGRGGGYQNKSHHRKLTLDKKILPPLLRGFEPATFQSRVRRSNHWAIPAPFKIPSPLTSGLSQNVATHASPTAKNVFFVLISNFPVSLSFFPNPRPKVQVFFCSLIKGITPKIRMLCFVLINSVRLNLLCIWIFFLLLNFFSFG